jgi:hypothetical protein
MQLVKQYGIVILLVAIVTAAVIIKSSGSSNFKYDAVKRAEPSVNRTNILTSDKLNTLTGEKLLINLDGTADLSSFQTINKIKIPSDSILFTPYKKLIFKNKGHIILTSSEIYKSASVWMILTQMGKKNVYILVN